MTIVPLSPHHHDSVETLLHEKGWDDHLNSYEGTIAFVALDGPDDIDPRVTGIVYGFAADAEYAELADQAGHQGPYGWVELVVVAQPRTELGTKLLRHFASRTAKAFPYLMCSLDQEKEPVDRRYAWARERGFVLLRGGPNMVMGASATDLT
ncbi:hypothetical protein Aab01nite_40100 [Paractinoplanes abujensis]|uniref:N-acetyltransferase domain-containing protein n=1 Tax=Paractinoplanes abujensis TaxID=882441 RepID=A0A7W7CTD3_9ACTN|nr:hypothetical protein [Actinoplanes abujensis]MBB4694365.1 hypothetical protein [Actinoplanes abujensis]GID20420.1 hypothetical protein Aab01nite_40100 [Actinoplanes abujensis]